jgi:hypothetical protein
VGRGGFAELRRLLLERNATASAAQVKVPRVLCAEDLVGCLLRRAGSG